METVHGSGTPSWPDLSVVHAPERPIFITPTGTTSGVALLAHAHRLAAILPDTPIIPLCSDLRGFSLLLVAALLRGQPLLLTSDRTPARLLELVASHGATCVDIAVTGVCDPTGMPGSVRDLTPDAAPSATRNGTSGTTSDAATGTTPDRAFQSDPQSGSALEGALILPDPFVSPDAGPVETGGCDFNPVLPPDRLVAIAFTSGSTGEPIAHRKHWGALVTRSVVARSLLDPENEPDCLVGTVPPFHMYGFETLVLQSLNTRMSAVSGGGAYPADWQQSLILATAPRVLVSTPLQLRALARGGFALPEIRRVVSAAAPLDATLAAEIETALRTEVMEIYGATEIGSVATRRTLSGPHWQLYPGIMLSTEAEPATISAPGAPAHPLADLVERDGPRGFRLMGRAADLIKLGGKRASIAALNTALNAIEGVLDGAFLAPDPEKLTDFTARMQVFAVAPGLMPDAVLQSLKERIDPVFLPRRVRLRPSLPRNAVGKLTLQALRDLAMQEPEEDCIGMFSMPATHPCLAGHFPGQPVVPGVMLLDAGVEKLGLGDLISSVTMVKFLQPVLPEQSVTFTMRQAGQSIWLTATHDGKPVMRATLQMGATGA